MASPVGNSYYGASGATLYCGRTNLPLWLQGTPINEWVAIAGTAGADNNDVDAWCDFGVWQSQGELILALSGGHDDSYMTQVSSISLVADAPAWRTPRRKNSVTLAETNYGHPYCLDGVTPSSRHTRYQTHICEQRRRIILIGSPSIYGSSISAVDSNGFSLDTNTWDAPGTFPSGANVSVYGTAIDDLGNIWARSYKWNQASNTLTALPTTYANTSAFDTSRRQLFTLCKGDGQSYDTDTLGVVAKVISEDLSTWHSITFNSSAAYTEFSGQILDYSAMTYDPIRDRFLFYYGKGISQGVIYIVTPNSGTVWDMSKLVQGAGSALPPLGPSTGAGTNGRFKYVSRLDGVALLPQKSSNIYFMRLG